MMINMSDQLLQQIIKKLDNMDNELKEIKSEQQSMNETQSLMQTQQTETNQLVRVIIDRQDETDAKLEALTMDVHKIRGDVTEMKEDISSLKQGQERQDKILASLAMRSLEQETELRDLKRIK